MSNAQYRAELFDGLCDDAAVFPPGNMPLAQAVPAHVQHLRAAWSALLGPFVVAAPDLPALAEANRSAHSELSIAVTVPVTEIAEAVGATTRVPSVRLVSIEASVPSGIAPDDVVAMIMGATTPASSAALSVFVELPRDERREPLISALAGTSYGAKLRTGGVRADLYPDEAELAEAVVALVHADLGFKATAGLHHAIRNTDVSTRFEQHGFLNLLVATGAARGGAGVDEVASLLADRNPSHVVSAVRDLDPQVRQSFGSFGTCSVNEPVDELVDLGLLPPTFRSTYEEPLQ